MYGGCFCLYFQANAREYMLFVCIFIGFFRSCSLYLISKYISRFMVFSSPVSVSRTLQMLFSAFLFTNSEVKTFPMKFLSMELEPYCDKRHKQMKKKKKKEIDNHNKYRSDNMEVKEINRWRDEDERLRERENE